MPSKTKQMLIIGAASLLTLVAAWFMTMAPHKLNATAVEDSNVVGPSMELPSFKKSGTIIVETCMAVPGQVTLGRPFVTFSGSTHCDGTRALHKFYPVGIVLNLALLSVVAAVPILVLKKRRSQS